MLEVYGPCSPHPSDITGVTRENLPSRLPDRAHRTPNRPPESSIPRKPLIRLVLGCPGDRDGPRVALAEYLVFSPRYLIIIYTNHHHHHIYLTSSSHML